MLFVAHCQALIADIFCTTVYGTPLGVNCGKCWYFGTLSGIVDNFGIFYTLGKNKHHPGLEPMTSGITARYIQYYSGNNELNLMKIIIHTQIQYTNYHFRCLYGQVL